MSMTDTTPADFTPETVAEDSHHDAPITAAGLGAIYAVLAAVVAAWGSAVYAFGLPGLYMPAVAFVPVMFLLLIVISKG